MAARKSERVWRWPWLEHKVPEYPMDPDQCQIARLVDKRVYQQIQECVGRPRPTMYGIWSSGPGWKPDAVGMARLRAVVRELLVDRDRFSEAELRPLTIEQILSFLVPAVERRNAEIADHWRAGLQEAHDVGLNYSDVWKDLVREAITIAELYIKSCERGEVPAKPTFPLVSDTFSMDAERPVEAEDTAWMAMVLGLKLEGLFGVVEVFVPADFNARMLETRAWPALNSYLEGPFTQAAHDATLGELQTYWRYLKPVLQEKAKQRNRPPHVVVGKLPGVRKHAKREDEWSRVMSKMTMATALGLPSVEKLNSLVEAGTYRLREAGNRQSWQICLKGIPEERRAKLI